ncbi:MAG TPA: helix-turn-helix domain-containing protein [Candidatus Caccenecus avistercoris]|nr:helix-turn-helix domain-containing protein [Candidatus Caccenecus avistercoris]
MNISNNLKEFLENKKIDKITATSIANYLGISKKTLSNYVNGDAYIPLNHLNKLSNLFDVSIDYLIGLTDKENYKDNIKIDSLDPISIGQRLKETRKNLKVSQEQVAHIIGVNKSSISRYEHGETLILTICLYTFCQKYNISSDYIIGKNKNCILIE